MRQGFFNNKIQPNKFTRGDSKGKIFDNFFKKIQGEIEEEKGAHGIQGIDKCPICEGAVNYIWSEFAGFTKYECLDNDCLPWPDVKGV